MPGRCKACGEPTVSDPEVGSRICPSCGTLEDPNETVLTSYADFLPSNGDSTRDFAFSFKSVKPTTARLQTRDGRYLAGQSREIAESTNLNAIQSFMESLSRSLSYPGLAIRAFTIFQQIRARMDKFRWGRKAKLLAGASLAVTCRETKRPDHLRDIAYLLDEPFPSLSRCFLHLTRTLHLHLAPADPSQHLPVLQAHLLSLLNPSTANSSSAPLPQELIDALRPVVPSIASVMSMAASLSSLLFSQSSPHQNGTSYLPPSLTTLPTLPTPSTATAILILSLESTLHHPLPHLQLLSSALGARLGVKKGAVMQRYKMIYEGVLVGIEGVPWAEKHEVKGKGKGGRSREGKRGVVAKGLGDVVVFWEEVWRAGKEKVERPKLVLEGSGEEEGWSEEEENVQSKAAEDETGPPAKRRRRAPKALEDASKFLLDPLAASTSKLSVLTTPDPASSLSLDPLHLLTTLTPSLSQPPTRLQLLATQRGGEGEVEDEELFGEGELEGYVRGGEEVERLGGFGFGEGEREERVGKERKRKREEIVEGQKGTGRIDMERLKRLLDGDEDGDEEKESQVFSDEEDGEGEESEVGNMVGEEAEAEEIGEWRSLSPGFGGFGESGEGRYDF